MKLTVPAILMVVAIAFLLVIEEDGGHQPIQPVSPLRDRATELPISQESSQFAPAASTSVVTALPGNSLLADFNNTKNGRLFVLGAWNRPAEGGRLYASRIVDACLARPTEPPDVTVVGSSNHLAAISAYDRLQALCDQFSSEELASFSGHALLKDVNVDVLNGRVIRFGTLINTKDGTARRLALKELIDSPDPLVFDDLGLRLSMFKSGEGKPYLFFDGESVALNSNSGLLAAYYLLPCGLGLACGSSDLDLMGRCVSGAGCYQSRFERVQAEFAADDPKKYAEILRYQAKLVQAVRSGDLTKFQPPPTPAPGSLAPPFGAGR